MEAAGPSFNRLIRVGYGSLRPGKLPPGEVMEVRPRVLQDQLEADRASKVGDSKSHKRKVLRRSCPGKKRTSESGDA